MGSRVYPFRRQGVAAEGTLPLPFQGLGAYRDVLSVVLYLSRLEFDLARNPRLVEPGIKRSIGAEDNVCMKVVDVGGPPGPYAYGSMYIVPYG
jgi:hypothetical protein